MPDVYILLSCCINERNHAYTTTFLEKQSMCVFFSAYHTPSTRIDHRQRSSKTFHCTLHRFIQCSVRDRCCCNVLRILPPFRPETFLFSYPCPCVRGTYVRRWSTGGVLKAKIAAKKRHSSTAILFVRRPAHHKTHKIINHNMTALGLIENRQTWWYEHKISFQRATPLQTPIFTARQLRHFMSV